MTTRPHIWKSIRLRELSFLLRTIDGNLKGTLTLTVILSLRTMLISQASRSTGCADSMTVIQIEREPDLPTLWTLFRPNENHRPFSH